MQRLQDAYEPDLFGRLRLLGEAVYVKVEGEVKPPHKWRKKKAG